MHLIYDARAAKVLLVTGAGSFPKNAGIRIDWKSILYRKESILFHNSMAKNGKKESIIYSQESESTQPYWSPPRPRDVAHKLRKRDGVIQNSEQSRLLVRSFFGPPVVCLPHRQETISPPRRVFLSRAIRIVSTKVILSLSVSTLSYCLQYSINVFLKGKN